MTHQEQAPAMLAASTGAEVNTLAGAYILTDDTKPIHFAEVQSARDAAPQLVSRTWGELKALLTDHRVGPKDGPGFMPCARSTASRRAGSATHTDLLVLDVDGPDGKPKPGATTSFDTAVLWLEQSGWAFAAYTTHSHQRETPQKAAGERYRVVVPLAEPLRDLRLLPLYGRALAERLGVAADVDRCSFEPERLMFYPRHDKGAPFEAQAGGAEFIALAELVPEQVVADELARFKAQECAAERANTHKANTTGARNQTPPQHATGAISPIDEFNRCYDTAAILEAHGYRHQSSRNGHDLYLYPGSATGVAGVWLFRDTGNVISFHSDDPLATRGPDGSPTAHDAFDCWALLAHGGDRSAALKAAGAMLTTTDPQTGQEVTITQMSQRNHARAQDEAQPLAVLPWLANGLAVAEGMPELHSHLVDLRAANDEAPLLWVLDQWMPCGEVTLLAAHGGSGKSYVSLALGVHVAMGLPFGGVEVAQGRVLFVSCEDDAAEVRRRLFKFVERHFLNLDAVAEQFEVLDLSETDPTLYGKAGQHRLLRQAGELAKGRDYRLIVIDNASDTYAANEIERADVRAFIRGLRQHLAAPDRAVLLLAHVNKASAGSNRQKGATEDYSGSTAWNNSVRSRWSLGGDGADAMKIEHQKSNRGALQRPIRLEWQGGVPVAVPPRTVTGDAAEIIERENREAEALARQRKEGNAIALLGLIREFYQRGEFLATSPQAKNNPRAMLAGQASFPDEYKTGSGCADLLRDMERDGLIERELYRTIHRKPAERWKLTAAGEARIDGASTAGG